MRRVSAWDFMVLEFKLSMLILYPYIMVWSFQFSLFIQTVLALLCRRQAVLAKNQAQQLYEYYPQK